MTERRSDHAAPPAPDVATLRADAEWGVRTAQLGIVIDPTELLALLSRLDRAERHRDLWKSLARTREDMISHLIAAATATGAGAEVGED